MGSVHFETDRQKRMDRLIYEEQQIPLQSGKKSFKMCEGRTR